MRDLTKSAFVFPWAVSMLGVRQIVNLVAPPADGRVAGAIAAFDAVTRATERQMEGWLDDTWQVAGTMQRGLVAVTRLRPPSIDPSALMRMAADPRLAPLARVTMDYGVTPLAWLDSFRVARDDGAVLLREVANKRRLARMVTQVRSQLGLDHAEDEPLTALVGRAADLEAFPRLWAIEGLGHHYGTRAMARAGGIDPQALLTDRTTSGLPPCSLVMLHAGLGRSFAGTVLADLSPTASPGVVRRAVTRFGALCRRSSRSGYEGAAYESLGLATRGLHRNLVSLVDREILQVEPEIAGYFWHGAGRAMYLDPASMLPSANAPRAAIVNLEREAPHDTAYSNALAGIAWETTLVNMQHPEVMEVFLRYHGALAAANDAFTNGVASALTARYDTTPDDTHIMPFIDYEPRSSEAAAAAWQSLVSAPCRHALDDRYGDLREAGALGQLFHYRPGPA